MYDFTGLVDGGHATLRACLGSEPPVEARRPERLTIACKGETHDH